MSYCDLLTKGDLIKSRWRVTHKIGGGGFGQIYQAYDKLRRESVAVKVESNSQPRQGIRMEVTVLRRIQNRQHVCELLSGGTLTLYNYMIMTLLGANLSELRRNSSEQCFTLSTSLRISLQILQAIESVHTIGFLHRDIKPSNFAIGRQNVRQIFILDFGLARKYTDQDLHVRPPRTEAGFRGTIRYASVNAHNNRELGRHDDLWSFFYMLIEFLVGSLPWSKIKDKENVGHMKETYDYTRFLTYLPDEFDKVLEHINELHYEDKPDYEFIRSLFISSIERLDYHTDDPYDWEISVDQDQTDSLAKIDQQRISSQGDERKMTPENSNHIKRKQFRSSTPNPTKQELHEKQHVDHNSPLNYPQKNRQLIQPVSRTGLLRKQTDSIHNLPLQQLYPVTPNRQQSPFVFNRIKLDSVGTDDQKKINHGKVCSQLATRSPDTVTRRSTHRNTTDHGQGTNNGLLTYISQHFSNAAAPGTPSIFSQWSPHNGETYTDDDVLKGNKNDASRADERAATLSDEHPPSPVNTRIDHSSSSMKNKSIEQTPFGTASNINTKSEHILNDEDNHQEYYLPPKHQCSVEQNIPVPFGTYVKNTRRHSNYNHCASGRQTSPAFSLQRFSSDKSDGP